MVTDGRLIKGWRAEVLRACDLLLLSVQQFYVAACVKRDLRAAESWRGIAAKGREELEAMLDSCRRMLEWQEATVGLLSAGGRGARVGREDGVTAELLYKKLAEVRGAKPVLSADWQGAMGARAGVEGRPGGMWHLVGLGMLLPPCEVRQVLDCCSNTRCAGLAGDSEAGVVLRRCGGACGGAAAYCCAACQRAHWAAGHREECSSKRSGQEGVGGTGKEG